MMNESGSNQRITFRSPHLMNCDDTALLIIDFQEKLVPHIRDHQRVQWNILRLISAAQILGVRVLATEQYPQGLGQTVLPIAEALARTDRQPIPTKTMFSCRECASSLADLQAGGVQKLLLTGIETHVCVAQTGFDCLSNGFFVYLAVDALGSRHALDHEVAIRRLENAGATATTTEAAMFEWCERAGTESFKKISQLVRQVGP